MTVIEENAEGIPASVEQTLKIISGSMAAGLTMMAGLVAWSYLRSEGKAPTPDQLRVVNLMTTVAMLAAVPLIVLSEFLWRRLLRTAPGPLGGRVQSAFIVRMACREGAGLLGLTVAYVAAINGTLRAYPAYWAALAPYGLFLGFLAAHWPTAAKLEAEARDILSSGPVLTR